MSRRFGEEGFARLLFTFEANEGAQRFYERHGFRIEWSDGTSCATDSS